VRFSVGTDTATGEPVSLSLSDLTSSHTHIIGRTNSGKTKALELLCRHIIGEGLPLIVIDGVGALYRGLFDYAAEQNLRPGGRLLLVNPEDEERVPGVNYLELLGGVGAESWAPIVLEGVKKLYREEDVFKPWLEEWGLATLLPLIRSGMTLVDVADFLSSAESDLREAILSLPENADVRPHWDHLFAQRGADRDAKLSAIATRGRLIATGAPVLRRMLGQRRTTIDWPRVMNTNGVVLANCKRRPLPEDAARMLGTILVHQVVQVATTRKKERVPPCFLVCDEVQRFASRDFLDALATLRNFGVYLILSHQGLYQLDEVEGLREALLSNARNRMVFSVSAEDAEVLAGELFSGCIDYKRVKDEIYQTKFWPHETTRRVVMESHGESSSSARSRTRATSRGTSYGAAWGASVLRSDNRQAAHVAGEDGASAASLGAGNGYAVGTSWATSFGSSFANQDASGESHAESTSYQRAESTVPFYEYEAFRELSSRTYYALEETWDELRGRIVKQPQRHAFVKLGSGPPTSLVTAAVEAPLVSERLRELYAARLYELYPRAEEIDRAIEARRLELLAQRTATYDVIPDHIENPQDAPVPARDQGRPRVRRGRGRHPEAGGRGP
jgi:hypothetical protein